MFVLFLSLAFFGVAIKKKLGIRGAGAFFLFLCACHPVAHTKLGEWTLEWCARQWLLLCYSCRDCKLSRRVGICRRTVVWVPAG